MKRLLIIVLAIAMCFAFVSCGGSGGSDPEPEGLSDEIYSGGDYDFGLELTDDFKLSGVFEKCEYVSLAEREGEFKSMLETGLSESGLDTFEVDDTSLKEELEHALTELEADGNPVTDEMAEMYNNMVFASASEKTSGDDWEGARIMTGIVLGVDDSEDSSEETADPEDLKLKHTVEYSGRTYHDPEEPDCEKICADLHNLMGIKADPSKLKEAFAKAIDIAEKEDKISELTQEITAEGSGYTENAYITVSAYIDDEELSFWIEGAGRSRAYE